MQNTTTRLKWTKPKLVIRLLNSGIIAISNQDTWIPNREISAANYTEKGNAFPDFRVIRKLDQMQVDRVVSSWWIETPFHAVCQGRASILHRGIAHDYWWVIYNIARIWVTFCVAAPVVCLAVCDLSRVEWGTWVTSVCYGYTCRGDDWSRCRRR